MNVVTKLQIKYSLTSHHTIFVIMDNFCNDVNRIINIDYPNVCLAINYFFTQVR
jgi:hypothetical protein